MPIDIDARPEQERVRLEKLQALTTNLGFKHPNDVPPLAKARDLLESEPASDSASAPRVTIAGRIVGFRNMGKAAFVHILDSTAKIQLYVRKDEIGEDSFKLFSDFDLGDIIEAHGYMFFTKTGEKTLHVLTVRLLVKSLVPPPEKWHGLADTEARYRQRYVDLFANPEVRTIFATRSKVINYIRNFLNTRGYLEVETPVLQSIAGGADARPFLTHHNTLNLQMNLRIATELPLKKLVVGGLERVYEIGRIFRNEGISRKHNPEFTSIEFYQAYATYKDLMNLTEELLSGIVELVHGKETFTYGEQEISFARPWKRISMSDSLYEIGGVPRSVDVNDLAALQRVAAEHKIELAEPEDWGKVLESLWGELVEPKCINPVFICNHPYSISPLARKNDDDPRVTDRFELIVAGMELANAFSELNDALDQRERFENQARRKAGGDLNAQDVEEDFLRALEYGMPPAAGEGIGIDRLLMLLTNSQSIREVILFPQLRPDE